MKKKVLIIGTGIGGAGIGALLSSTDEYNVEIFEKNSLIGGRFSTYEKDGWKIDIGCHLIANCDNGTIGWILKKIGRSDAVKWAYLRAPRPAIYYIDNFFQFPQDISKMNVPKEDLMNLLKFVRTLNKLTEKDLKELDGQKVDMRTYLQRYTKNQEVLSLFAFFAGLYFVVPDSLTPASEWLRCYRQITKYKTSGYPIGGTISIAKAFCDYIKHKGGNVHTNKEVKRIIVENNKAIGIETKDGIIKGDLIISNAGVKSTVLNLIGKQYFPNDFIKKIESYKYSYSSTQIKIALDKKISIEKMIMFIGTKYAVNEMYEKIDLGEMLDPPDFHPTLMIPVISNIDPSTAPEGKQLIIAGGICQAPSQGYSNEQHKEKWKEAILNSLEKIYPEIREHILWIDVATPIDIKNFVNEDGNIVGIGQTIDQMGINRPTHELPPLENIFCCCADTGTTGIGGELAANSAIELFSKITNKN